MTRADVLSDAVQSYQEYDKYPDSYCEPTAIDKTVVNVMEGVLSLYDTCPFDADHEYKACVARLEKSLLAIDTSDVRAAIDNLHALCQRSKQPKTDDVYWVRLLTDGSDSICCCVFASGYEEAIEKAKHLYKDHPNGEGQPTSYDADADDEYEDIWVERIGPDGLFIGMNP
jgi:hypothetical protein